MGLFDGDCLPPDAPDNQWSYCPSVPAALVFFVLFLISFFIHCFQAIRHMQLFCAVIIIGVLWEAAAFGFRVLSAKHPTHKGTYDASFLLLLLAPVCVNAFDYMIASRIVRRFLNGQKVLGLGGKWMGKLFVCCDIVSFIVQIGGGLLTLSSKPDTAKNGLHIVTGGVIFQQLLIVFFACVTFSISTKLRFTVANSELRKSIHRQIHAVQASLFLISYRIIFRIVQFSSKQGSSVSTYIDKHEWTVYVFDAGPMLLAVFVINYWHPGRILRYKTKYDENAIPLSSPSGMNLENRPMIPPESRDWQAPPRQKWGPLGGN